MTDDNQEQLSAAKELARQIPGVAVYLPGENMTLDENDRVMEWRPVAGKGPTWYGGQNRLTTDPDKRPRLKREP